MKKVLIITYYFPPSGGAGVQRTLKFVKYLNNFGWYPIVLTVSSRVYMILDHSLCKDIPKDTKVIRTFSLEPSGRIKNFRVKYVKTKESNLIKRLVAKFLDLFSKMFIIPDAQIGWFPSALYYGFKIIKKENIDVIYITGNPFSTYFIGWFLKLITGVPFIVDFRDPWTLSEVRVWPNKIRKKIEEFLERRILKSADKVISATDEMTEDFLNKYSDIEKEKFVTITNGYDFEDFFRLSNVKFPPNKKFTMVYTGVILDDRTSPVPFLKALSLLIKRHPEIKEDIKVIFAGKVRESDIELIDELSVKDIIEIKGYIPHEESVKLLVSADILLFFIGNIPASRYILTGKLFEYIGSKKPILAIIPEGPASHLIRSVNAGVIINPSNIEAIEFQIYKLYLDYKQGTLKNFKSSEEEIKKYDRRVLTKKLADIFDSLLKKNRILIMSLQGLGNAILATPIIKSIKEFYNPVEITIFVRDNGSKEIFETNPDVDKIIVYKKSWGLYQKIKCLIKLKKEKYSKVIIPYPDTKRTRMLGKFFVGEKNCIFYKGLFKISDVEKNLYILRMLGIPEERIKLEYNIICKEEEFKKAEEILKKYNVGDNDIIIGMHIGSGGYLKRWSHERFAVLIKRLIEKYNTKIILIGGKGEEKLNGFVKEYVKSNNCINLCSLLSVREVAALIKKCDLFVANDSGILQLTIAVGTPTVAVLGPTPTYRITPTLFVRKNIECSPCYDVRLRRFKCKKYNFECLDISVDEVFDCISNFFRDNLIHKKGYNIFFTTFTGKSG